MAHKKDGANPLGIVSLSLGKEIVPILEAIAEKTKRSKTQVLRELILQEGQRLGLVRVEPTEVIAYVPKVPTRQPRHRRPAAPSTTSSGSIAESEEKRGRGRPRRTSLTTTSAAGA